jgi:hypothetical protein
MVADVSTIFLSFVTIIDYKKFFVSLVIVLEVCEK